MRDAFPLIGQGENIEMKTMSFERFDREALDEILEDVLPYSEMSFNEKYFLNGIVRFLKPRKVLEVGVSSGGETAIYFILAVF